MLEKKIERYIIMNLHMELVRRGRFSEARDILMFLGNKTETLELGASEWAAERQLGCSDGRINCLYVCRKEKKWKVLDQEYAC